MAKPREKRHHRSLFILEEPHMNFFSVDDDSVGCKEVEAQAGMDPGSSQ